MPDTLEDQRTDDDAVTVDRANGVVARIGSARRAHPRIAVAVVVALLAAALGGGYWWTHRGLPGDVAVRVGETDVTLTQLRARMATVEALYGVTVPDGGSEKDAFWRDAAHSVAVGLVLSAAARDEDVVISAKDVDQSLSQVITSFFGGGSEGETAFSKALANAGTSEAAVRDELRRQLEINALFANVTSDVASPDDAAVAAAYDDRRCALRLPEKRRVRNIVVASKADAQDALRRLRRGDAFASVVAAVSIDASTQDTGGDIGLVAASDLEAAYADAAFAVGKGKVFGPVQGEYGWNVGRVDAIQQGRVPTQAEARDGLRQTLFSEAQSKVWRSWLTDRIKAAEIRYGDDHEPKDPLALPADGSGVRAVDASDGPPAESC